MTIGGIKGIEKNYFFDYYNPWIYGNHISLKIEGYRLYTESPIYNYAINQSAIIIGSGFYNGYNHKFKSEIGYGNIILNSTLSKAINYTQTVLH